MRLIFLGSGEFGLPTLQSLCETHEVLAVISQPDKPAGRKRKLTPTPIAQYAIDHDIKLLRPENINEPNVVQEIDSLGADAAVVIAFGQKLGEPVINALGQLAVNLHSSLLPKYRGAAPINWAVVNNDKETGVCVIGLAQKMDAGDIYASAATPIEPTETAGELHDRLAAMGPTVVQKVLDDLTNDSLDPVKQNEADATLAPKLSKADGQIDFTQSAEAIRCRIHGLTPWPGVTVQWQSGDAEAKPLKLLRVRDHDEVTDKQPGTVLANKHIATGQGSIELLQVQPPGKRPMSFEDFLRGNNMQPGDQLS